MGITFLRLILEHIRHRPVRVSLTVLGVAIGVSAWLAIRLANAEVLRVFHQSVDSAVGRVSLVVQARNGDLDERLISRVRRHPGVRNAIPVVSVTATVKRGPHRDAQRIRVWGLDLLDGLETDGVAFDEASNSRVSLDALLAPEAVFVDEAMASRWKLARGDRLALQTDDRLVTVTVHGIMKGAGLRSRALTDAVVMDIAAAQALFGRVGRLDRIDIVKAGAYPTSRLMSELKARLPASVVVSRVKQRDRHVEAMIASFQLNLEVLSTVGLLIGLFLVYNAVGFSVVQHRREIGILRALGFAPVHVQILFLGEAAVLGGVGGLLGAVLGRALADTMTALVGQSVADLYAPVSVRSSSGFLVPWEEGLMVGVGLAVCGALRPCWEAGKTVVVKALAPGDEASLPARRLAPALWMSAGALFLSMACTIPGPVYGLPLYGYAAAFFLLLACILLGPVGIHALALVTRWPAMQGMSVNAALAADHVARASVRSSVTISALVVGLAVIVGVGTMIRSFRIAVEEWIDQTIMADIIVGSPLPKDGEIAETGESGLPMALLETLRAVPGVAAIDPYRQISARVNGRLVTLVARDLVLHAERSRYLVRAGDSSTLLRQAVTRPGAMVSEVLAQRLGVAEGDELRVEADVGVMRMPIVGVFYDYATDGGKVVIDQRVYRQRWRDDQATVFAVYLDDGARSDEVRRRIEARLGSQFPITTISHQELRKDILVIFDRTFRVTSVLELIALCVALLGIVNTLTTAMLERQREFATLRALGAGVRQIHHLVYWEAGYLAGIGVVLGLIGGVGLATVLVKVINKQAFGWTIPLSLSGETALEAVAVAGIAAMLAAYVPAKWATKQVVAEGLRYE